MSGDYAIALARPTHLAALPAIELSNNALFPLADLPPPLRDDVSAAEDFAAAQEEGRLWVALARGGEPVGFALADWVGGTAYLDELDVHRDHQRRGLGAALVRAVCDWARGRGSRRLLLITFRFVPWNMPWYERLGFAEIPVDALSPGLRAIFEGEVAKGLPRARPVGMALDLAPHRGP